MEDNLIAILESLGYPVLLQGSLLESEDYPDDFFTYWNDGSNGDSYYDNAEHGIVWDYSVNFYSNNPNNTYSKLLEAKKLLIEHGWTVSGGGYSVMSDEPTHTGRGISVTYKE